MSRDPQITRVLLVEDEPSIAERLRRGLNQDQRSYEVVHCETLCYAIEQLESEHYDVVLADLRLPDMDGLRALRYLQKPIIWLSYPDEGHGLSKLQNRIDFQYRLQDFFDHHLRGEPAPGWMTDGVPQTEKERHLREYAPRIFRPRLVG